MDRRRFLAESLLALPAVRAARGDTLRLEEARLADFGKYSARSMTAWYLARIESMDRKGAAVNAVIEVNPDALAMADALDRERRQKGPRGPLHGVPVLLKDNIDTGDRMSTTAGSLALVDAIAPRDAAVAERVRAAGAVILGKTNLSEWAGFRSTHSISGWSGRGGLTRNPYCLDRNACGSSSGSAAAVAANFCAVALGTETDGSVTAPASVNGIVGIKPTVGLVSARGIIPISHTQDTAGPMARTVRDAAVLLGVMAGKDYMGYLDPRGLRGARLGVERNYFGANAAMDRVMEECLAEMKRQGAELVDPANLPSHGEYDDDEMTALLYEFKAGLNAYLAGLHFNVKPRTLADLIAFNSAHRSQEMPFYGQDLFERAQAKGPLTDRAYRDARARCVRLSRAEGIDAVVHRSKVQAILAPTAGPAPLTDFLLGDPNWPGCTTPAAVAGYPHITVPAGFVHGLPVGISFFGAAWSEPVLLKLAYAFEQATKTRRQPAFLPSLDVAVPH